MRLGTKFIKFAFFEFQSTHPLGVRPFLFLFWAMPKEFQSTHPLGVRPQNGGIRVPTACFNPRTHSGCDLQPVSSGYAVALFQSTHPLGVRPHFIRCVITTRRFQSTHPLGVRRRVRLSMILRPCFNPRTHSGCDKAICEEYTEVWVSIHAPTRGATPLSYEIIQSLVVSIHAPTRGATIVSAYLQNQILVSIHAPTRGATYKSH